MATDSIEIIVPLGEEDSTEEIDDEVLSTMEPETTSDENKKSDNTLAIVLGTLGGVAVIAIIIGIFYQKSKSKPKPKPTTK
jgi:hypothetical protein